MRMRSVAFGVVVGFLLAVNHFSLSSCRITARRNLAKPPRWIRVQVVHQIQRLNELGVYPVKYTVQKVVGLEEQKVLFSNPENFSCLCRPKCWPGSIFLNWPQPILNGSLPSACR